jgi:hypothetical protein
MHRLDFDSAVYSFIAIGGEVRMPIHFPFAASYAEDRMDLASYSI